MNTPTPTSPPDRSSEADALKSVVMTAMQDAWNDICTDSGNHPTDLSHARGKRLEFRAGQWARYTADLVATRAAANASEGSVEWRPICAMCQKVIADQEEGGPVNLDAYADKIMAGASEHERSVIADLTAISTDQANRDFWPKAIAAAARGMILRYREAAIATPPAPAQADRPFVSRSVAKRIDAMTKADVSRVSVVTMEQVVAIVSEVESIVGVELHFTNDEYCTAHEAALSTATSYAPRVRDDLLRHCVSVMRGVIAFCEPKPRQAYDDPTEHNGGIALAELESVATAIEQSLSAAPTVTSQGDAGGRDVPAAIRRIAELTVADRQRNDHCTADPMFMVEKKRRIVGLDEGYAEEHVWLNGDWDEITDTEEIARLDAKYEGEGVGGSEATRVGVKSEWEHYAGPWFTKEGAQAFMDGKKHEGELRLYVDSGCRNFEWKAVQSFLMSLAAAPPPPGTRDAGGG